MSASQAANLSSSAFFQIKRVKLFRKPAVDRSEKLASLIPLALIAPEPRRAYCGAEFPGFACCVRATANARSKYACPFGLSGGFEPSAMSPAMR
jgi:hypothetical protein